MKIVVIDDDPTGSQTVHNCLLLLKWDYLTLLKAFKSSSSLIFILANTRSLSQGDLEKRLKSICEAINFVIDSNNLNKDEFIFVSRGDSTLRGHNFIEPNIINKLLGPFDATFHIPAFIEGGRLTRNGKHYVNGIPAHETIYAKDKIFGFSTNDLKELLIQKSNFKLSKDDIQNLRSSDLSSLEIQENKNLFQKLQALNSNKQVIVDIENYLQLKNFTLIINLFKGKKNFLYRTAASFIKAISNIESNTKSHEYYAQLRRKGISNTSLPGLIIVGSYIDLTTKQLQSISSHKSIVPIEICVSKIYHLLTEANSSELSNFRIDLIDQLRINFSKNKTPVLFTSREFLDLQDSDKQFNFYNFISCFIAELVSEIKNEIGYLISKGGITSHYVLEKGFSADYVYLEGQIFTGISIVNVKLDALTEYIPVVTFPGNFGDENSLLDVWQVMENIKIIKN